MIFRIEKTKNYTVMANYHLREKSMSLKAKGLLSWMLSNTDDWDYSIEGIVANCKENRTAITTALQELVDFGYLEIKKLMPESYKDENGNRQVIRGRIEYEYIVHEQPLDIQATENLCIENHTQRNTKTSNTNKVNKNNSKELLQNSPTFEFGKSKPKKESLFTKCINMIDSYTTDTQIRLDLVQYLNVLFEMKKDGYILYANVWKGLLRKLNELSTDPKEQHKIICQSIERGYKSFFPVNSYSNNLKEKPWEAGVSSVAYTDEELAELRRIDAEREAKGMRIKF